MKNSIQKGTICVEDLEIGMSRMLERKITQNDILLFSKVSGDQNPVHLDEEYAQQTIFGKTNCARYANCKLDFGRNCRTVAWTWDRLFESNTEIHQTSTPWSINHNHGISNSYRILKSTCYIRL